MPQVIITEEYLVQFLQTFIFLVGLLEQSNFSQSLIMLMYSILYMTFNV